MVELSKVQSGCLDKLFEDQRRREGPDMGPEELCVLHFGTNFWTFFFATFVKYWAHNCFILIAGTFKLNCLNFGLFIARAKINMYQLWLQ